MCDMDPLSRTMSSAAVWQPCAKLAIILPRLSKLWATPFAGPVLPEVKKITAGSVGAGIGEFSGAIGLSKSVAKFEWRSCSEP